MVVQIVRDVEKPHICIPRITCHRIVVECESWFVQELVVQ